MESSVYQLSCRDCPFERAVEDDVYEALDRAEDHEDEYSDYHYCHRVDVSLLKKGEKTVVSPIKA